MIGIVDFIFSAVYPVLTRDFGNFTEAFDHLPGIKAFLVVMEVSHPLSKLIWGLENSR